MSLVVMVTVPPAGAAELARGLVEHRLAGCVNIVPGLQTVYRWGNEVAEEPETLLIIKTNGERYPELERYIKEHHPYEVPEIVALPVDRSSPEFSQWLNASLSVSS
ncbi:divalent-cation tolerance protein CutA [Deinococcus psychrotolerans]|uniref:Divalent-cation tolerance protein CutA n=2 Tax=Deinococcus TaxID=1298 RepID=A0A553UUJ1_9DEIO|nr:MULTISPECIES: divalent-cation tolerance protein CutA [Deinococcus]AZI43087.1 divalent-cation tolerance protein CutA [Deinococcus psychrotolerans]TSA83880.1 divalent-cation tolerance protein CutA [Deinococcus detaillensis]